MRTHSADIFSKSVCTCFNWCDQHATEKVKGLYMQKELKVKTSWAHPTEGDLKADTEHTRRITKPIWPGNTSKSSRKSWSVRLARGTSRLPCYPAAPTTGSTMSGRRRSRGVKVSKLLECYRSVPAITSHHNWGRLLFIYYNVFYY